MIGPGTGVRVYLACGVTDMRKGIAGLSAIAQDVLRQRPTSGAVFAFRGRRGDRIKLLYGVGYDIPHELHERQEMADRHFTDLLHKPDQLTKLGITHLLCERKFLNFDPKLEEVCKNEDYLVFKLP